MAKNVSQNTGLIMPPSSFILGIGVDVCAWARVAKILQRYPQKFPRRILTPLEYQKWQEECPLLEPPAGLLDNPELKTRHAKVLSKYFAAKEAVAKAFGCGIGQNMSFQDVVVVRGAGARPFVQLKQAPKPYGAIHLSLSDEENQAVAFVVVENV